MPPISWELNQDLSDLAIAKELGVPVTEMWRIPGHWIGAALTMLEWQAFERRRSDRRSKHTSKSAPRQIGPRGS